MVSFWTVPSLTSTFFNTEREDTFNNRLVKKGNECFVYLNLTQFPNKKRCLFAVDVMLFRDRSNVSSHQW